MKYILFLFSLLLVLLVNSGCMRQDRAISSYVFRNKIVERKPGNIDTLWVNQIYRKYDRENRSYFEAAKFEYKGETQFLFASDMFNDLVRFNILTGFPRGPSVFDKFEKVNYIQMDTTAMRGLLDFFDKAQTPTHTNKINTILDYTISENAFVVCSVYYENPALNQKLKRPVIRWVSIWLGGRRHTISHVQLLKILKANMPGK